MKAKRLRLMLLRHGNTFEAGEIPTQIGYKTDLPLTSKGNSQAKAFASHLIKQGLSPFSIYCGRLARQVQTAKIVHSIFPKAHLLTQQEALDEIDYGRWEGLTATEIAQQWPQDYQNWCEQGVWPEHIFNRTKEQHLQLLEQWLAFVKENTPDDALVVAISSNGLIRLMLQFMPTLWDSLVETRKMDTYKVGTGHYCDLTLEGMIPMIHAWNVSPE